MQWKLAFLAASIGCVGPVSLLFLVPRQWAARCSIAVSLAVLIAGAWVLDKRFSAALFAALIPVGCALIHARSKLRDQERAALSIRR